MQPKRQKKPEEYHTSGQWEGLGVSWARNCWIQDVFIQSTREEIPANTSVTGHKVLLKEEYKVFNISQTRASYYSKKILGIKVFKGLGIEIFFFLNRQVIVIHFPLETQRCLSHPQPAASPTPLPPPPWLWGPGPACPASPASSAPSLTWCCLEQSFWEVSSHQ